MLSKKNQAQTYYNIAVKANEYHVNYYIRVGKIYTNFFDENNVAPPKLGAQLDDFLDAKSREDTFYNQIRKSDYTAVLTEWDNKRDSNTSSLRTMAQVYANNPDDAEKQAWAQRVLYLLKHFNISIRDNFEMQGSRTLQFCQCIDATAEYRAAIDGIGAGVFYEAMKEANQECLNIVDLRNEERAQASQDKMVDLRKQTDAEYRDLILITNAFALSNVDENAYDPLINNLNQLVNYYEKTVFAGSGDSSSSSGNSSSGGSSQQGGSQQGGSQQGGSEEGSSEQGGSGDDSGTTPPSGGGGFPGSEEVDGQGGGSGDDSGTTPPSGGGGFPGSDEIDDQGGGSGDSGGTVPPSGGGGFGG